MNRYDVSTAIFAIVGLILLLMVLGAMPVIEQVATR